MRCRTQLLSAAAVLGAFLSAMPARTAAPGPYAPSRDAKVAADQRAAYDVVHRYEILLNTGDTAAILKLYATDSVAEWNDKPTAATNSERKEIYESLFKAAKFSTVFGYASVEAYGDTAVIRTFHHKGAVVLEGGNEITDLNREVFVLRRTDGEYKIVLYIFNTNPVQGEG